MTAQPPPTIVLLSASDTLSGIDPLLRQAGTRLVRLTSLEPRPVDPARWLDRLQRAPFPDTVVVTSRAAVGAGVEPWQRVAGPFPKSLEFWAVGPRTAQALRQVGVRRVRRPRSVGAEAVAKALGRKGRRTVVYLRSESAGKDLARALRGRGHHVVDLVVYRLGPAPRLTDEAIRELSGADLLVATSPSGLSNLRRQLDRPTFRRISRTSRLVVLGERSRRAARGHGFRHTSIVPSTTAQRFTRTLLRELRDART